MEKSKQDVTENQTFIEPGGPIDPIQDLLEVAYADPQPKIFLVNGIVVCGVVTVLEPTRIFVARGGQHGFLNDGLAGTTRNGLWIRKDAIDGIGDM